MTIRLYDEDPYCLTFDAVVTSCRPQGDAFADRNKYAMKIDFEQQPPMFKVSETHSAATWLLHPDAPKVEMPKIISARIERMKTAEVE